MSQNSQPDKNIFEKLIFIVVLCSGRKFKKPDTMPAATIWLI